MPSTAPRHNFFGHVWVRPVVRRVLDLNHRFPIVALARRLRWSVPIIGSDHRLRSSPDPIAVGRFLRSHRPPSNSRVQRFPGFYRIQRFPRSVASPEASFLRKHLSPTPSSSPTPSIPQRACCRRSRLNRFPSTSPRSVLQGIRRATTSIPAHEFNLEDSAPSDQPEEASPLAPKIDKAPPLPTVSQRTPPHHPACPDSLSKPQGIRPIRTLPQNFSPIQDFEVPVTTAVFSCT